MSPKAKASAVDLSTLVSLARVKDKSSVNRVRILQNLTSPWAKGLAEAIIDDGNSAKKLSSSRTRDLASVRQLAGVED
jgi:hypothetical protein